MPSEIGREKLKNNTKPHLPPTTLLSTKVNLYCIIPSTPNAYFHTQSQKSTTLRNPKDKEDEIFEQFRN